MMMTTPDALVLGTLCAGAGSGFRKARALIVTPTTLNFGVIDVGVTDSRDLTITNNSVSTDPVTVTALNDDVLGNLLAAAEAANGGDPIVLAAGQSFSFEYNPEGVLVLDGGQTHTNVATVTVVDDEGSDATDDDSHTITAPKTAATLLRRFGHLEAVPDNPSAWGEGVRAAGRLAATLREARELAYLFRTLATLVTDIDLGTTVDDLAWTGPTADFPLVCAAYDAPDLVERVAVLVAGRAAPAADHPPSTPL